MPGSVHYPAEQKALNNQYGQVDPQVGDIDQQTGKMPNYKHAGCQESACWFAKPGIKAKLQVAAEDCLLGKGDQ